MGQPLKHFLERRGQAENTEVEPLVTTAVNADDATVPARWSTKKKAFAFAITSVLVLAAVGVAVFETRKHPGVAPAPLPTGTESGSVSRSFSPSGKKSPTHKATPTHNSSASASNRESRSDRISASKSRKKSATEEVTETQAVTPTDTLNAKPFARVLFNGSGYSFWPTIPLYQDKIPCDDTSMLQGAYQFLANLFAPSEAEINNTAQAMLNTTRQACKKAERDYCGNDNRRTQTVNRKEVAFFVNRSLANSTNGLQRYNSKTQVGCDLPIFQPRF